MSKSERTIPVIVASCWSGQAEEDTESPEDDVSDIPSWSELSESGQTTELTREYNEESKKVY